MTILWAGGEMGSVIPSDASALEESTAIGAKHDTDFARCHLLNSGGTSYHETPEWSGATDFWLHIDVNMETSVFSATQQKVIAFLNSSGTELLRLSLAPSSAASGAWALQRNIAGTWTTLGSTVSAAYADRQTFDIHFTVNSATGVADLYMAGTKRIDNPSIDLSAVVDIAQLRFYGMTVTIAQEATFSQGIAATTSTIGKRLMTIKATGTGSTDQWTGAYTAIDETVYADADFIYSDTAAQVELFAGTLQGSTTGYAVSAVVVTARAKKDGAGPQNLQLSVRTASTNYFSSSIALDAGYTANVGIWETNPNTTQAWTTSDLSTLQFGVKSIA